MTHRISYRGLSLAFGTLALSLASLFAAPAAMAQTANPPMAGAATSQADTLYRALGEKPGLVALMDTFVANIVADARIAAQFKEANVDHLKTQLVDQICVVSGGPCEYKGASMKLIHANLDITKADFHALVEDLQAAMDVRGIPFATQNQLLARLAPMHRDVITVK
ncbi:group I truncated hemoglobin [Rhodoferax aquaticus]|uniref:Group 1 truncated hemoglobin n=1 Tax=Rhodoferax aquaticus TaxID=2527691 RepID=A0A515ES16_9BURK|nr:group 1 truncated hemoglobin [Rhodoferax aquaticus]QDL55462.1 group 1 truncated hemoglobin [Rhodoferax aquaticus]